MNKVKAKNKSLCNIKGCNEAAFCFTRFEDLDDKLIAAVCRKHWGMMDEDMYKIFGKAFERVSDGNLEENTYNKS